MADRTCYRLTKPWSQNMSAFVAARSLGVESGWTLSNLEIQKVLYVAQMLHLGRTDRPLFSDQFQAWDYGPVVPDLYHSLKRFGGTIVPDVPAAVVYEWGTTEAYAIADAYSMMQHMSAGELIAYTHRPGGAWEDHYRSGVRNSSIPIDAIKAEWELHMRPSGDAIEWAEEMADNFEASSPRYLDPESQRAFRTSLSK